MQPLRLCLFAVVIATGLLRESVLAASLTYTGKGPDRNASTPSNWDAGKAPGESDDVIIDATDHTISWDNFAPPAIHSLILRGKFSGTFTLIGQLRTTGDLVIQSGTLTSAKDSVSEITCGGCLEIGKDAKLIVRRSSLDNLGAGQKITAGEVKIDGILTADGQGFDGMKGPSPGIWGTGASHGGMGTNAREASCRTYGLMDNPSSLGSGGFGSACGGGAIALLSRGKIAVSGVLSADGERSGGAQAQSGASGGSINLTAAVLTGNGIIRANGGDAVAAQDWHSPGGGGRISLNGVEKDEFRGKLEANGGISGGGPGFAGTICLSPSDRQNLVIGGNSHIKFLRLVSDDTSNYSFGTVTIHDGGVLEIDGNPRRNKTDWYGGAATLLINKLEVKEGGHLSADGLGYTFNGFGVGAYAEGGCHGGECGEGVGKTNDCYGSVTNPIELGSPGGGGAAGGGSIILVVKEKLLVAGRISADGINCSPDLQDGGGGGSGGTVNITAPAIEGKGSITANGGSAGKGNSSGGGGGRIGIVLSSATSIGDVTIQCAGGPDKAVKERSGAAGTIFLKMVGEAKGHLIIDNLGMTSRGSTFLNGLYVHDTDVESVILRNGARLRFSKPFPSFVVFDQK